MQQFYICSSNAYRSDISFIFHSYFHSIFIVKPFLIRGPHDQTVVEGTSVTFQCRVGGDPLPDVLWRRSASGGNMPLGKKTEIKPCLVCGEKSRLLFCLLPTN